MNFFKKIANRLKMNKYKNEGLILGSNVRFVDVPNFGSEPYLIEIGENSLISFGCSFITHDGSMSLLHNKDIFGDKYKKTMCFGKIKIGKNCFVGANCTILRDVTIGDNVIVGTGSIVTKDIPSNSVVAGIPAKVIMTLEEYAEKCTKRTPKYNYENFINNKKMELLKMYD